MRKLRTLVETARTFGARDGMLRLGYELQRSSGLMSRRMRSVGGWDSWNLKRIAPGSSAEDFLRARRDGSRPFFFADSRARAPSLRTVVGLEGEKSILAEAQSILDGNLPYFGRLSFACGFPPNWFRNPATGRSVSPRSAMDYDAFCIARLRRSQVHPGTIEVLIRLSRLRAPTS